MSQKDTVTQLENVFGEHVNKMRIYHIPAATNDTILRPNKEDILLSEGEQSTYRSGVGILLWLMKHSRPDIANSVREASKVMDGATKSHWKYLMRFIKYVIDTKNYTLCHRVKYGDKAIIEGYCDSNYAGDKDTRSVRLYV